MLRRMRREQQNKAILAHDALSGWQLWRLSKASPQVLEHKRTLITRERDCIHSAPPSQLLSVAHWHTHVT